MYLGSLTSSSRQSMSVFSTKSSMAFNFTFTLKFPSLRSIHSHDVSPLAKSFCVTYWYQFLINFLAPLSVKLNSMIASFNLNQGKTKISWKYLLQVHRVLFADISKETFGGTNQLHWMSLRSSLWEGFYRIAIMYLFSKSLRNIFEKVRF